MSELFTVMRESGEYDSDDEIREEIREMRKRVREGESPDDVLFEYGLEPDYFLDIM